MPQTSELYAELDQTILRIRPEFEALLRELVEIPTISMDPAYAEDIGRGARKAAEVLQECGKPCGPL